MIVALIFVAGLIAVIIGGLTIVSTAMPSFGGRRGNEGAVFIVGCIIVLAGIIAIFFAGSLTP